MDRQNGETLSQIQTPSVLTVCAFPTPTMHAVVSFCRYVHTGEREKGERSSSLLGATGEIAVYNRSSSMTGESESERREGEWDSDQDSFEASSQK